MLGNLRQAMQGRLRRRRGQALVEFAITVPVMVTLLLFSMYFYEVIQIKLKTQEIARYAAWEATGYPLHDYGTGDKDTFSSHRGTIIQDAMTRYANLKGGTIGLQNKQMMVEWQPPIVILRNKAEPKIPGGGTMVGGLVSVGTLFNIATAIIDIFRALSFQHANATLVLMMGIHMIEGNLIFGAATNRFNPPGRWKFNTKGYIESKVRVRYRNLLIPKGFMERDSQGGWFKDEQGQRVKHFSARRFTFNERATVLADSWRLHYGDNVEGVGGRDSEGTAYYKQVDRMAWVSPAVKGVVQGLSVVIQAVSGIIAVAAMHPPLTVDPVKTTLVSIAYKDQSTGSGKISLDEDKDTRSYDTSPMPKDSGYQDALEIRYNNFMGCHDPEKLGCFDSLSSDNPFGDYIAPPGN